MSDETTNNRRGSNRFENSIETDTTAQQRSVKIRAIQNACKSSPDIFRLTELATSKYGLCNDESRRLVWPVLLGFSSNLEAFKGQPSWRQLPRHKDEDQVDLDVNRSFIFYPKNESERQLDRRKEELSVVITRVLRKYPTLSYFQGYHDIAQVFLLVLGVEGASEAVAHLSLLRIRDFMLPNLSPSEEHLKLLPPIMQAVYPDLYRHLSRTRPYFALAATLTLYSHDVQEYDDIARLFDFLLAQPAVMSVYFFAVVILTRKEEIFEIPADEPDMLHSILSKLPETLNIEDLVDQTMKMFVKFPPEKLPGRAWAKVSRYSVLKTTRILEQCRNQTLEDGEKLLQLQVTRLQQQEARKKFLSKAWQLRRTAGGLGLAIAIGLLSYWLGKRSTDGMLRLGVRGLIEMFRVYR